ncbi:MAG: alpha/beta hydrolase, partial [Planctomycetaceae bacterium]
EDADRPEIRIYLPPKDKATGTAIVVCPGGGYGALAMDHEGHQVAQWLNTIGVAGIVLKYRLGPRYRYPAALQDAQRAVRYVRAHAETLGIDPHRVGIMGFSAGGHLASTVATHFDAGDADSDDPLARQSSRPDFAVLAYPVISFTEPFTHAGSRRNLLGDNPDPALVASLSNETQVTADTPPTFLFHTGEDAGVPVENSLVFYAALRKAGVPAELHVYQDGPHGVGLAPGVPGLSGWKDRLAEWLRQSGFLSNAERAAVKGTVTVDGQPVEFGTIQFIPAESESQPVGWGRVRRGRFDVTAERGAVVGRNRVEIIRLGRVEPRPTIDAVQVFTKTTSSDESPLTVEIRPGENELHLDVKSP